MEGSNTSSAGNFSGYCNYEEDSVGEKAAKVVGYCVIILFSIIGNILVIVVIHKNRRLKSNTNRFITNMCISDLCVTVCVLPHNITMIIYQRWLIGGSIGNILCKLVPFVQDVCGGVSIISMTVIAFDRFYAIVLPMRVHVITKRWCYILVALTWVISTLIHHPYLIILKLVEIGHQPICRMNWHDDPEKSFQTQRIYIPIVFCLLYVIPLISIAFFYSCVIAELFCKNTPKEQNRQQRQLRQSENREVSTMLITVVVLFAVSWVPMNVISFLHMFKWVDQIPCSINTYSFLAEFLMYSNAAQNAFIYFTLNKRFKKGLRNIVVSCGRDAGDDPNFTHNGTQASMQNQLRLIPVDGTSVDQ